MSTTESYINYVLEELVDFPNVRVRKMFGEYMVYIDDKPIFLVCDNTVFIKKFTELIDLMSKAEVGFPYPGAKEHYILDLEIDNLDEVIQILKNLTPVPKKRKKKEK